MEEMLQAEEILRNEFRCTSCDKLLGKEVVAGIIEIKCPRCGTLNVAFDKMYEQVIITDAHGVILYINKATEEMTGFTALESIGKKPSDLWGNQMDKEFYVNLWTTISGEKKAIKVSMTNKKKNGELYDVSLVVSPILNVKKEIAFFVGIEVTTTG